VSGSFRFFGKAKTLSGSSLRSLVLMSPCSVWGFHVAVAISFSFRRAAEPAALPIASRHGMAFPAAQTSKPGR
jgi:hypothetical protein